MSEDELYECPLCETLFVRLDGDNAHCFECDWIGPKTELVLVEADPEIPEIPES